MQSCFKCTRVLSTPYNLRRHLRLCHNIQAPSRVGKTKTMERWVSLDVRQKGGDDDDDDDDDADEISIADYVETADSGFESDEETVSEAGENWVFNRFLQSIDRENEDFDLKQRQVQFRKLYINYLIWIHHLRRNTIHKKIMTTVRNFTDSYNYDKDEALHAAVEQRKFLLDCIVEDASSIDDETDE